MELVSRDEHIGNVSLTEEEDGKLHLVTEEEQMAGVRTFRFVSLSTFYPIWPRCFHHLCRHPALRTFLRLLLSVRLTAVPSTLQCET